MSTLRGRASSHTSRVQQGHPPVYPEAQLAGFRATIERERCVKFSGKVGEGAVFDFFAYGNTKIENRDITPEAIERAASVLADDDPK